MTIQTKLFSNQSSISSHSIHVRTTPKVLPTSYIFQHRNLIHHSFPVWLMRNSRMLSFQMKVWKHNIYCLSCFIENLQPWLTTFWLPELAFCFLTLMNCANNSWVRFCSRVHKGNFGKVSNTVPFTILFQTLEGGNNSRAGTNSKVYPLTLKVVKGH